MNLTARMPSVVSSSTSVSPEKRYYGKQYPWKFVDAEDRLDNLVKKQRTSLQQIIQNWKPDKTSWRMVRQVRPDHEEILLDGNAQSVRYGETLRDRSGQPDNVNSKEVANS